MTVVGLIAEYNPFHNGHKYHIEKARELTHADMVIVVMSGNFVQRGVPALMPKHLRAETALKAGASLVIELPVCYATASAEQFAYGAVSLLDKLGCVDAVCFGSECGEISMPKSLADVLAEEPEAYREILQRYLRRGDSFPVARQMALKEHLKSDFPDEVLSEPNNILAIEYLKALRRLHSRIRPIAIQRISSHYHDEELKEEISSATAIRNTFAGNSGFSTKLTAQIPETGISLLKENYQKRYPVFPNDVSLLLKCKLLKENKTSLQEYADVSEELANRIANSLSQYLNFEQFCRLLKTKEVTYSRISRSLIHILLDIKKSDMSEIEYAHVLGFRADDSALFSKIKQEASIPLLSKLTNVENLSESAKQMLRLDILAADFYESIVTEKFRTPFQSEYCHPVIRI